RLPDLGPPPGSVSDRGEQGIHGAICKGIPRGRQPARPRTRRRNARSAADRLVQGGRPVPRRLRAAMSAALLLARLVLVAVFAVSGIAKLADRAGSRQALEGFGVSPALAAPSAVVLPMVELAIAAGLLIGPTVTLAALAATVLLATFVVGLAV